MLWIRSLVIASCLVSLVEGRVLRKKRLKGKKLSSDELWLVDSIYYLDEYQGDAPAIPSQEDLCPPVPDVTSDDEACKEDMCQSDSDCSDSYRCCFNGCIFTCLVEVKPAPVVDWRKEPRRSRSGISWLVDGPKLKMPDAEPCNTSPTEPDEDPLLCPYGYVCHVDETLETKKRKISGQGYCIKQTADLTLVEDVSPAEASALRTGKVCTVDNIVLLEGAKMRFQDKICRCKKGVLSCSERKDKKSRKTSLQRRNKTKKQAVPSSRRRRKRKRKYKQDSTNRSKS